MWVPRLCNGDLETHIFWAGLLKVKQHISCTEHSLSKNVRTQIVIMGGFFGGECSYELAVSILFSISTVAEILGNCHRLFLV
jgi:hypothetical protein